MVYNPRIRYFPTIALQLRTLPQLLLRKPPPLHPPELPPPQLGEFPIVRLRLSAAYLMSPQLVVESSQISGVLHHDEERGATAGGEVTAGREEGRARARARAMGPTESIGVPVRECEGEADTHMCIPPEMSSGRVIMLM
jgi:hypothetical protein